MNTKESEDFLKGKMAFSPERMMRYIRSRARLSSQQDLEDILQNALIMVTKHFDPTHNEANLALYCMSACNKAIAHNLERYHKVSLKKKAQAPVDIADVEEELQSSFEGAVVKVSKLSSAQSFVEEQSDYGQFRTVSLDSFYAEDSENDGLDLPYDGNSAIGFGSSPEQRAILEDLINMILFELPSQQHQICFILKYVEGFKREDLISCLKMDARSIDTIDKKISRTLAAMKSKFQD
jgi:DNA-directed RNA polymerase specialized sigma24 family protein